MQKSIMQKAQSYWTREKYRRRFFVFSCLDNNTVLTLRGLGLLIVTAEAVLASLVGNFVVSHARKLLGSGDIADLLSVTLGEDEINLLEGAARGLGVEEVDDGEEDGVHGGEEGVGAPTVGTGSVNHDGSDHDDEEVPEPVGDGGGSVGLCAGLERVDLGGVQPGERQPGSTEEGDVGKETDSGSLGGSGGTGDQSAESQDHGSTLADGSDEEELAATDTLNSKPRSSGEDRVDDHVDTTEEESHVVVGTDGLLEENGEVVDDGVATGELLHHLRRGTENETSEVLGLSTSEESRERSLAALVSSGSNGLLDGLNLGHDLGGVAGSTVETSKNSLSLFTTIVCEEPTRRLGKLHHHDENDGSKDNLESDGESPNKGVRAIGTAIVDPVSDQRSDGDVTALDADELSTVVRLTALGLVGRDGGGVDTVSDTSDCSTDDELGCGATAGGDSSDLDNDTDNHDDSTEEDGVATTETVTEVEDEESTEEATDSVDGDNKTLVCLVENLGEVFCESGSGDDTGHDTLIITEKKKVSGSDNGDEFLETLAGLAPVMGNPLFVVDVNHVEQPCDGFLIEWSGLKRREKRAGDLHFL